MSAEVVSPTTAAKMYDLFPNTKPANGKYVGVISGLLRNLPPREVLSTASAFHQAGAVHDINSSSNNATVTPAATAGSPTPASPSPADAGTLDLLASLCEDVKKVFDAESVIINVKVEPKDRLVLVGDIHGQFRDLQRHVLSLQREASDLKEVDGVDCKYLFLGDYVDRGPQGVEVITLLLALKVEYPNNVFMIRGNHEDAQVSRLYGFLTECKNKLQISSWGLFNDVFSNIPLGATVECEQGGFFCCHGGLSPTVESIAALQFLNRLDYGQGFSDDNGEAIDGLLWSDPGEHDGFRRNMRGCGYTFGTDTTRKFCESNGIDFVCRAHQMVMRGYQWEHDSKLLTLFSAPNYCGINHNDGAIAIVMGTEANKKHLEANPAAAATAAAPPAQKASDSASNEDRDDADDDDQPLPDHVKIPIIFQRFASAPAEPCTLYYCSEGEPVSSDNVKDVLADCNGSPVNGDLPTSTSGDDSSTAATPRPAADPNLNIEGLKYFSSEEKKE